MSRTEPEIMKTAKTIAASFASFFFKNLYYVFAIFAVSFLYQYLMIKYIPPGSLKGILLLLFEASFYPIIMIFSMYVVNAHYAGKKITNLHDLMDQGKEYFQPLIIYYGFLTMLKFILPGQLFVIAFLIMIKLAFVDQLIYYRNYNLMDAVRASFRMTTIRVFFLYFIGALILFVMSKTVADFIINGGSMVRELLFGWNLLIVILLRFFVTVSYRELIKIDFYRAKS